MIFLEWWDVDEAAEKPGVRAREEAAMMDDTDSIETPRRTIREQVRPGRVERLLIVRPDDGADEEEARSELEDLPGVVGVTINTLTSSFDIAFDSTIVSDDELAAALQLHGYDLVSWQEVIHAGQQRIWLLEQIPGPRSTRRARTRGPRDLCGWCHEGLGRRLHPSCQGVRSRDGRRNHPADTGSLLDGAD